MASTAPHCSTQGTCVECLDSSQCPAEAPACDNGTCVAGGGSGSDGGVKVCPHELMFQRGGLFTGGQVIRVSLDDFVEHPFGNGAPTDIDGSYSPDGMHVALIRGGSNLWVMDLDGSNAHQVDSQTSSFLYRASWSPDGTRLAYGQTALSGDTTSHIYVAAVTGTSGTNITTNAEAEQPEWSPDGSTILFSSNRTGNYDVFTMDSAGGNVVNLTNRAHDDGNDGAHWSKDGQKITFTGYTSIWRADANGANALQLTMGGNGQPRWGSNGLIYYVNNPTSAGQIWVTNINGTNQHALTTDTHINQHPVLSPDGTMIAWARAEDSVHFQIWVANADGTSPVRVTNTTDVNDNPTWRPCP